jgi:2-(1,2-epoxy-1,2-dihydrophenyl)acetyl-CoA isomerase
MSYDSIVTHVQNNICLVKLNQPEVRNPISEVRVELLDLFQKIREDDSIKAVILTGEGTAFSAGGNIKKMQGGRDAFDQRNRMKVSQELIRTILNMEKPIIAAVNGAAAGAGVSLALACDLVLAARSSYFIQSFVKIGALPDLGGIHFLTQLIGPHRAKQLMMFGEKVTAEEAFQLGLINEVIDDEALLNRALELAMKLANGPSVAIGLIKRLVDRSVNAQLEELLELEAFGQGICFQTEDLKEGVNAFLEKRPAQFKGR